MEESHYLRNLDVGSKQVNKYFFAGILNREPAQSGSVPVSCLPCEVGRQSRLVWSPEATMFAPLKPHDAHRRVSAYFKVLAAGADPTLECDVVSSRSLAFPSMPLIHLGLWMHRISLRNFSRLRPWRRDQIRTMASPGASAQEAAENKRKATRSVSPPPTKRKAQSSISSKHCTADLWCMGWLTGGVAGTESAVASFFQPTSQKPKERTTWSERAPDDDTPATLLVGRYEPEGMGDADRAKRRKIAAFDLVSLT